MPSTIALNAVASSADISAALSRRLRCFECSRDLGGSPGLLRASLSAPDSIMRLEAHDVFLSAGPELRTVVVVGPFFLGVYRSDTLAPSEGQSSHDTIHASDP